MFTLNLEWKRVIWPDILNAYSKKKKKKVKPVFSLTCLDVKKRPS